MLRFILLVLLTYVCMSLHAQNPFITQWETAKAGDSITISINPNVSGATIDYNVDWGDGSELDKNIATSITHGYSSIGPYTVKIYGNFPGIQTNLPAGNASKLISIDQWGDISWVTMQNAFRDANKLNITATDTLDLSLATNCSRMFFNCANLNADINHWDMSNIETTAEMFAGCTQFNQELNDWNVVQVTDMNEMFSGASSFDQNLGDWEIVRVEEMSDMLINTKISITNYDSTIIGWHAYSVGQGTVQEGVEFGVTGLNFCLATDARQVLIDSFKWIFDGDSRGCPFITTWRTTEVGETIDIPTNSNYTYNYSVDWDNDGIIDDTGVTGNITHEYATPDDSHEVAIYGDFPAIYLFASISAPKLHRIEQWGDIEWETMDSAFYGATNMTYHATDLPDLVQVTSLASMFSRAESLDQPLGNWNTSNVTDMSRMFSQANSFNQPIDSWNTSNVTDMSGMFLLARAFNQPLSTVNNNWNTEKVTNMSYMFNGAINFNKDISNWNTSNVVDMRYMFNYANDFNQPLNTVNDSWNTEKVTNMNHMFSNAYEFNRDISLWNTSNVTNMNSMFRSARSFNQPLNTVNNSWNTEKVTDMSHMFDNARDFNGDISMWNTEKVTDMSYMFYIAEDFNKDIGMWNTSIVTDMSYMFYSAGDFNKDISNWNTNKVINMSHMFYDARDFNQPLNTAGHKWNTEKVTDMSYMFSEATTFNRDISLWNTSNVTNMNSMFRDATVFDQDISIWNTGSLLDMSYMFYLAREFNKDISMWNTSNVTKMNYALLHANTFDYPLGDWNLSSVEEMNSMLSWSGLSQINYDSTLIGWSQQPILPDSINLRPDQLTYCEGESARRSLIAAPHYWIFIGDDRYCNSSGSCAEITTNTYTQLFENIWNVPDNWSDFRIPDTCDEVIIATDKSVILFADVFCYTLEIEAGGEIEVDGHELTVTAILPSGN